MALSALARLLVLLLVGPPPVVPPGTLAPCPAHPAPSTRAPDAAPTGAGCRATPTEAESAPSTGSRAAPDGGVEDATGYRHLGAVTGDGYAGVTGGLGVSDPGVRSGTNDFVAVRFMAVGSSGGKGTWLEAGWTEDGWQDAAQHVYTYNTNQMSWSYYDQYPIKPGDTVWFALQSAGTDGSGAVWRAWLWWGDRWNLLAEQTLPIGTRTPIEQYVEVYTDPARGRGYPLPRTDVEQVRVEPGAGQPYVDWRPPDVATDVSPNYPGYCVDWLTQYTTWYARTC